MFPAMSEPRASRTNPRAPARRPCALAVGGLDPGGGAGIAADLRAFAAAGAFGCAAVAVVTVQSTAGMRSARALGAGEVVRQAEEVLAHQDVRALKTGALGSAAVVRAVAALAARHAKLPLVVDPVLAPTRGRGRLTAPQATRARVEALLPRATIVTANALEAEALLAAIAAPPRRVRDLDDAREAAVTLRARTGAAAVLVKGGHLPGHDSVDVLATESRAIDLPAPRLRLARPVHGTGCVLASLIAGRLAVGDSLLVAVRWAKKRHHAWLSRALDVGGPQRVLG